MSYTNRDVVERWLVGKKAKSRSMSTDGKDIYSYGLCIGKIEDSQSPMYIEVYDYTRRGGSYHSQTTSTHVGRVFHHLYSRKVVFFLISPKTGIPQIYDYREIQKKE